MKCHVCGFENEEDSLFCEKCGTKLMKGQAGPAPAPGPAEGGGQKPVGKNPKGLYMVIAVLFVGMAVVIAVYLSGNAKMEKKLAEAERSLEAMSREKEREASEAARIAQARTTDSHIETTAETTAPPATTAQEPLVIVVPEPATAPPQRETVTVYINSGSSDYILPGSDSRYLSGDDLRNLTKAQLRLARNEIYARHGRKFKDRSLQEYFNAKSWYYGYVDPDKFVDDQVLNRYEIANRDLIVSYENQ